MRLRNIKNAHERILQYEGQIILYPEEKKGLWHEVFGNNNPIHVEIGMGKGKFILEHALKHPEINYIGIEKYESVIVIALDKIAFLNLPNLKLIAVDASDLDKYFQEGEIQQIYLNFSDPWPKTGHAKRRLTSVKFLTTYDRLLGSGGKIELKTDNMRFFEYSMMSLLENNWLLIDFSVHLHSRDENIITTEYEDKFVSKGMPIYYLSVERKV